MRILLDEKLPVQLKRELADHDVRSIAELKRRAGTPWRRPAA